MEQSQPQAFQQALGAGIEGGWGKTPGLLQSGELPGGGRGVRGEKKEMSAVRLLPWGQQL